MIQGKRIVVLGKHSSTYWLKKMLEDSFAEVELVENQAELKQLAREPHPLTLLATDSFPGGIPVALLRELKVKLVPRLIICLADTIDSATEVELRSLGISFLGSYITFNRNAEQIFAKAISEARCGAQAALTQEAVQVASVEPLQPNNSNLPHILLVDDEEGFLSSMVRLLHNTPCRLLTAGNAEEALTIFNSNPIDLLITDYLMPGRNGLELIFAVHRQSPETGLVMLTAIEEIETARVEIEQMAIFDLYLKPLDRKTLAAILSKYLEQAGTSR